MQMAPALRQRDSLEGLSRKKKKKRDQKRFNRMHYIRSQLLRDYALGDIPTLSATRKMKH